MEIVIDKNKTDLGIQAAAKGAEFIRQAIQKNGSANIIVATGASQFEMLSALRKEDVDWTKITGFHLDEYINMPASHPASFRKYLKERFVDHVALKEFVYINGENDPKEECVRVGEAIRNYPIDVAFIGIGENGHLAFNDPPADFETNRPYIEVTLDIPCRNQQLGEGWFKTFDDVPERAISMSIRQIMKSRTIICTVPDQRKADAVKKCVEGAVTPDIPASILQNHLQTWLFLDDGSASLLAKE